MIHTLDLEEIAFDDSEAYFQEDFGTPVSDQEQAIFDPLDDIADVNKVPFEIAHYGNTGCRVFKWGIQK